MRAAIYARVSSAGQRDQQTIESQLYVLRAFVLAQGWELVDEYCDDGRSAKTGMLEHRDAFTRLMRDAEAHRFELLVVLDVNRLTRTGSIEERAEILGPFQRLGIQIATPSTGIQDLRSFLGEFWVTVQALVAAEENRKRAAAIAAGKLRAIAEGRKPAGPTPYGYKYSRELGEWSIDEAAAAVIREIYKRVIAGESTQDIAEDLYIRNVPPPGRRTVWERHKVWKIATTRTCLGEWIADKRKRLALKVPTIIDQRTFDLVQAKLIDAGKRGLIKTKHIYLLEGLATCAACGSPVHIRSATKGWGDYHNPPAYICRARKLHRFGEKRCTAPIEQVADVDDRVWSRISEALVDPGLAAALNRRAAELDGDRQKWEVDVADWKRKLGKLDKHEAVILARFRREQISEAALDVELEAVSRERAALRLQLEAAEQALAGDGEQLATPAAWLAKLLSWGSSASQEARQRVVRVLVKKAVFDDGRVKLTLRVDLRGPQAGPASGSNLSVVRAGYSRGAGEMDSMVLRIRLVA